MQQQLTFRRATAEDVFTIQSILLELDLGEFTNYNDYWVASIEKNIAGIMQIQENAAAIFASNIGVKKQLQNQRIATKLINHVLNFYNKPMYLRTIIPEFYQKIGFTIYPDTTSFAKNLAECRECQPDKCVCMQKLI